MLRATCFAVYGLTQLAGSGAGRPATVVLGAAPLTNALVFLCLFCLFACVTYCVARSCWLCTMLYLLLLSVFSHLAFFVFLQTWLIDWSRRPGKWTAHYWR